MNLNFNETDSFHEKKVFINRIVACVLLINISTVGLVVRLVYLQVVGHAHYSNLAKDNRVKIFPLAPTRGMIIDRNGDVLADNFPTYSLEVFPDQVPDLESTLTELKKLLNLSNEEIDRFNTLRRRHKVFEAIPLRLQLSEEEIAIFSVRMPHFPGIQIQSRMLRTYPYGELTAHVVGYVGRISEAELQNLDPSIYSGTYLIGKSGVEKAYEELLHGKTGYQEVETNVQGRPISVLGQTDSRPGSDLYLNLDIGLQKTAHDALRSYSGALVAIEPSTGHILAMVSNPSFDPNPFVQGISRAQFVSLQNSPDRPLYDRVLRGIYPPGSTVKPFMALAGLAYGQITAGRRVNCPGFFRLPGSDHSYRDWKSGGHGGVDLRLAITQSCDVYFYQLALRLGIDRMNHYMKRFGFGEITGIDIDGEKAGIYPSTEWKLKTRKQVWFPGESLIAGIGQGYVQATPLQMVRAIAILANKGRVVVPRVVDHMKVPADTEEPYPLRKIEDIPIPPGDWRAVVDAMIDVVHSPRGTAKGIARGLTYHIAGKTGTAQVFSVRQDQVYKRMKVTAKLKDHAWFVAFAPAEAPRIAIAVIAENGGHGGSVAAPMAKAVIQQYLKGR